MPRRRPVILLLLLTAVLSVAWPAHAIVGGRQVNHPAVVQIAVDDRDEPPGVRCTGTAISDQWILTAQHCLEFIPSYRDGLVTPDRVRIHYSNDKRRPGPGLAVDRFVINPRADMALVHLAAPHPLAQYPELADALPAIEGRKATLYGYGRLLHDEPATWLRAATLRGAYTTNNGAGIEERVRFNGVDGTSSRGDSGGPVLMDGRLIGVNVAGSHGSSEVPTDWCAAVQVPFYRDWIRTTSGV